MLNYHTKIPSQVHSQPYTEVVCSQLHTQSFLHTDAERQKTAQIVEKALWSCVYSIVM